MIRLFCQSGDSVFPSQRVDFTQDKAASNSSIDWITMEPASTNVVFANMLQNQHIRRAWRYLRPAPTFLKRVEATADVPDVKSLSTTSSAGGEGGDESFAAPKFVEDELRNDNTGIKRAASANEDDQLDSFAGIERSSDHREVQEDQQRLYGWDCTLEEEAEEDYTNGPCRLRAVPDGDGFSVALMLKLDLSSRIQQAVEAQRFEQKSRARAELQIEQIESFEDSLRDIINDKDLHLSTIVDEQTMTDEDDPKMVSDAAASLRRELEVLQNVLDNMATKKKSLGYQLQGHADEVQVRQAAVMEYLSLAFIEGLIISPANDATQPIEVFDLDTEYQDMAKAMYGYAGHSDNFEPEPLTIEQEHLQTKEISVQSPEQLARAHHESKIWEARQVLGDAERHFDSRGNRRDHEWQEHRIADFNGLETRDASREAFDLRWVVDDRLATRALIEAEVSLAKAKADAAEAGVETSDPQDDFTDYAYEFPGHPVSEDREVGVIVPNDGVESWRNAVTSVADLSDPQKNDAASTVSDAGLNDWDYREVEMGDSSSCVDWDCYTEDIIKWQTICKAIEA